MRRSRERNSNFASLLTFLSPCNLSNYQTLLVGFVFGKNRISFSNVMDKQLVSIGQLAIINDWPTSIPSLRQSLWIVTPHLTPIPLKC